jgi:hypothetical protein
VSCRIAHCSHIVLCVCLTQAALNELHDAKKAFTPVPRDESATDGIKSCFEVTVPITPAPTVDSGDILSTVKADSTGGAGIVVQRTEPDLTSTAASYNEDDFGAGTALSPLTSEELDKAPVVIETSTSSTLPDTAATNLDSNDTGVKTDPADIGTLTISSSVNAGVGITEQTTKPKLISTVPPYIEDELWVDPTLTLSGGFDDLAVAKVSLATFSCS